MGSASPETVGVEISVLVADDHPILREGLTALIGREADMTVVGEAGDGQQALAAFLELQPDVTIIDLQMPILGGLEAIERMLRHHPKAVVIVLTTFGGDEQARRALKLGAKGFILKNAIREELVTAVRSVHRGQVFISPEIARELAMSAIHDRLSEREIEIIRLVAAGRANRQIAEDLGVSPNTVKAWLKSIYSKLGVEDRTQAAFAAARKGLIDV